MNDVLQDELHRSNLTDGDLTKIDSKRDKLVGALQERYGWANYRANAEVDRRYNNYRQAHPTTTNTKTIQVRRWNEPSASVRRTGSSV
jgi:hypothetical protein